MEAGDIRPSLKDLETMELEHYYQKARALHTKTLNEITLEWEDAVLDLQHYSGVQPGISNETSNLYTGKYKVTIQTPYKEVLELWQIVH